MNTMTFLTWLAGSWLAGSCFAAGDRVVTPETTQPVATEKSAAADQYVLKARPTPVDTNSTPPATTEVFQDVVIPAGKNVTLQSQMDYSTASTVAVSVLCNACTTKTTSLSSQGLALEARWQPLRGGSDIATQAAGSFAYFDAGGAIFNVYAEQFNLELVNKGTAAIVLDQVTIFRRSQ